MCRLKATLTSNRFESGLFIDCNLCRPDHFFENCRLLAGLKVRNLNLDWGSIDILIAHVGFYINESLPLE